jgi:HK97 family phage major capsid protein
MTITEPNITDLPYADQVDTIAKSMTVVHAELDEILGKGDDGYSGEDLDRINRKFAGLATKAKALELEHGLDAMKEAAKRVYPSTDFVDSMEAFSKAAASNGLADPTKAPMTLGEAVIKSPAIQDWLRSKVNLENVIPDGSGTSPQVIIAAPIMANANYVHPDPTKFDGKALGFGGGLDAKNVVTTAVQTGTNRPLLPPALTIPGFVDLAPMKDDLFLRQICTNISLGGSTSWEYVTITGRTNNAGVVPEALTAENIGIASTHLAGNPVVDAILGGVKPESAMTFARVTGRVETIAHHIPITRNAAMDAVGIMQEINAFLVQGIREKEESEFLFGTGTTNPPRLQGLLNTSNPYGIQTLAAGANTDIDAVLLAIAKIRKQQYRPNWLVINPDDYISSGFMLAKDAQGNYQLANPRSSADQIATLWGLSVLVTQSIPAGTFVVGDFRQALIADRMQTTIYISDSHNDRFVRNLLTVLAEERVGFGVRAPLAFCQVTP